MSYIVLARKYRPLAFDEVLGQETVATTLKNAIKLKRLHHAFLFSGPRGVGKTSMARIFSRALNCKKGPVQDPCGKCPSCVDITEGRSLDVIEIDGASTRGIDDIREIRESIKFSPSYGQFKIYIIDEVHQITSDGFNALLKTLEEPPGHAKFIFATTVPQKIPATILSRCQRFDFKRIPIQRITEALEVIAKKEGIRIHSDALLQIAKASDGSLRDAESLLDQISSFSHDKITFDHVKEAIGSFNPEDFVRLFDSIAEAKGEEVLRFIDGIERDGKDPAYFLEKNLEHLRNLMILKVSKKLSDLVEGSDSYRTLLAAQSEKFSRADLFYFFSLMVQGLQNVKRFQSKRTVLEMTLLKCALREPMIQLNAAERHKGLQSKPPGKAPEKPQEKTILKKNDVSESSEEEGEDKLQEIWPNFLRRMRAEKMSAASFLADARPVGLDNGKFVVGFHPDFSFHAEALAQSENTRLVEKQLSDLLGQTVMVDFRVLDKDMPGLKGAGAGGGSREESAVSESVKSAIGIFGGRVLKKS